MFDYIDVEDKSLFWKMCGLHHICKLEIGLCLEDHYMLLKSSSIPF